MRSKIARLAEVKREAGTTAMLQRLSRALLWEMRKLDPVFRARLQEDLEYDATHGTDTSGTIYLSELGLPEPLRRHGNWYEPAQPWVVRDFFESLPVDLRKYVYVDLGSGKGRALLLASKYPLKRIIGVELAEALHLCAVKNLQVYDFSQARCRDIESLCMSAEDFAFPLENLVISVFNSFEAVIMKKVLDKLVASLREAPRAAYFIYVNPLHKELLENSGLFTPIRTKKRYVTYAFCSPALGSGVHVGSEEADGVISTAA